MTNNCNPDSLLDEFEARQTVANYVLLMGFNPNAITLLDGYTWNMVATELMTHTARMANCRVNPSILGSDTKSFEGLPAAQAFIARLNAANGVR
jgi:hypothetical protein